MQRCLAAAKLVAVCLAAFQAAVAVAAPNDSQLQPGGHGSPAPVSSGPGPTSDSQPRVEREDLLLYNRVPKSGSSTVQDYLDKLSNKLGYKTIHYVRPPEAVYYYVNHSRLVNYSISQQEIRRLARHLAEMPRQHGRRVCVDYHFPYLNFTELGMRQPLYINTLRNPIERVLSQFFYGRYGPRPRELKRQWLTWFGNLTVEQCMDLYARCGCTGMCLDRLECTRNQCSDLFTQFNAQMMFFCTWGSPDCRQRDKGALAHAKRVLEQAYVAFGILERHDQTLEVLERTLPRFFRGISRAKQGVGVARANPKKEGVAPRVKERMRAANALDLEFYEYATRLFDERHRRLVAGGR